MAQDKRGRPPEPPVDEVLNEVAQEETGDDFVAGPTQRNDVGNTKRAAAKATGVMGASKKLDPDLDIGHVDDNRVTSGSTGMSGGAASRARVPAPGNAVDVPKGTLVRGHPTASQSGGKSTSSTGDEKPPKRSARAHSGQQQRPLSKGGNEER